MSDLARALTRGELRVLGRLPDASNLALLCEITVSGEAQRCIYKPTSGERPLWDFPGAVLAAREVLTAEVARHLGWDLIPETVWRTEGPFGPGMCQEWIEPVGDPPVGLFPGDAVPAGWREVASGSDANGSPVVLAHEVSADLRRLIALDAIVNNADRKGGHVLRRLDGRIAAVDHGVSFHVEPKLRTVLWGLAGERLDPWLRDELDAGEPGLTDVLRDGAELQDDEVAAAAHRLARLRSRGRFPYPSQGWPALPWPPM